MPFGIILKLLMGGLNPGKIFAFVAKYWKQMIFAGMAGVIFYQNFFETRFIFGSETIPSLEKRLAESEDNLLKCADGNKLLSGKIEENNTRIKAYEKLTKELEAITVILGSELSDARDKTDTEIEVILKDPTPKTCKKAIDYLRKGKDDLKW